MKTLSIRQPWVEMIDRQQNWLVTFNNPDLIAEMFPHTIWWVIPDFDNNNLWFY